MEQGIERLTALVLLLTCLSHIAVPRVWATLFARVRGSGELAGLAVAAIHAPLGLMIVAFHHVWRGPEMVVTLIGYALLLKGTLHLIFPGLAARTIPADPDGDAWRYRAAGLVMLPLALWIGWMSMR